ncbi:MAG: GFA family protein [Pseudomonadota bacterium]|nr:GFA family protein [Pseudomonadota bacterium]
MPKGQCHCGAVKYEMPSETIYQALCHCRDCRRQSGAPVVGWALVPRDRLTVDGDTKEYASSELGRRQFCGNCGTSLFYTNETVFPGSIDVQIATLDDPDALPPQIQVQVAERIGWMTQVADLPEFERYPDGP